MLYGVDRAPVDFDFIVENPILQIILSSGWRLDKNRYGNPKFFGERFSIDFVPLKTIHSIQRRKLNFTFDNFLTGTPLIIQSIDYNVHTEEVVGEIGKNAIKTRTIAINNPEQTEIYTQKKEKSIEETIREKAESLGFKAIF